MMTYKINYRFQFKKSVMFRLQRAVCVWVGGGPSDEIEPVLLVEIYNRYYKWSCNGYIIILIVEISLNKYIFKIGGFVVLTLYYAIYQFLNIFFEGNLSYGLLLIEIMHFKNWF